MSTKLGWVPFYGRDWQTDPFVKGLSLETRGFYFEMLLISWYEHGIKDEWINKPGWICSDLGITQRKFRRLWAEISAQFEQSLAEVCPKFEKVCPKFEKVWLNVRLENERTLSKQRVDKSVNALKTRYSKASLVLPAGSTNTTQHNTTVTPIVPFGDEPTLLVLGYLNKKRKEVSPNSKDLLPSPENTKHIRQRLRSNSADECYAVIDRYAEECKRNGESKKWFNAISPFRPDQFARTLALEGNRPIIKAATYEEYFPVEVKP